MRGIATVISRSREFGHPLAAQRDLDADRHLLADLKPAIEFLAW